NYSKETYRGGTQTWKIVQDEQGIMYFANNNGLLTFSGNRWQVFPNANRTIIRSIAIAKDGKIYAGGQGEIGYYAPDSNGMLFYHSLNDLIPPGHRNFADIWTIIILEEQIFFLSTSKILLLENGQINSYTLDGRINFMGTLNNQIVAQRDNQDLFVFQNDRFIPLPGGQDFSAQVIEILTRPDGQVLFVSLKSGIYFYNLSTLQKWRTEADAFLRKTRIHSAQLLDDQQLVIGTALDGMIVLDAKGKVRQHINKKTGLQNNHVLGLTVDKNANVWLGLDNGIDFIELSSPFSNFFPDGSLEGSVYASQIHEGQLYCATVNGLYQRPWQSYYDPFDKKGFELVEQSTGQCWGLDVVGEQLVLGHNDGTFLIQNQKAKKISSVMGGWIFLPHTENLMVGGHYEGLQLFEKKSKEWRFKGTLEGLKESARIMVRDETGSFWMSHPYRGIYKIRVKDNLEELAVRFYGQNDGLPSNLNNHVFKIKSQILVTAETGIFRYDVAKDNFFTYPTFNDILGQEAKVKVLQEDQQGNIWYMIGEEVGMLLVEDEGLTKQIQKKVFPQLSGQMLAGFENIYPVDQHNVFIGSDKGLIHFSPEKSKVQKSSFQIFLNEVYLLGTTDSLIFGGYTAKENPLAKAERERLLLGPQQNAISFSYSNSLYAATDDVEYSYWLEGLEPTWSDWSSKAAKEYNNLSPGKYTFHLRARYNQQSPEQLSYPFQISPPWYAHPIAWVVYFLLFLALIATLLYFQKQKYQKATEALKSEQQEREVEHQQIVTATKEKLSHLRNEKLQLEIQHKNKELASATLHLTQKGEILVRIQKELKKLAGSSSDSKLVKKEINRIMRLLNVDNQLDNDWEQFAKHFDQVHHHFLQRLQGKYPQLSPNDHRLCAYLRMNLSTKEIANLMNLTVRGVEASRYRLRKKLHLETGENLTEFMLKF
ncbi:MAG: triple tyrosine motif-containing protein, partial [Bacteroidota bacterium]